MLRILLKKQLLELNQTFFYNRKKAKMRSKAGIIISILLYVLFMVGVIGGMFALFCISVCAPMAEAGMSWLYFAVFGLMAIMLGTFGSIFNTYSGLYQARDNDLLLSMPIPAKDILIARLLGVYFMGLMFSAVIMLPTIIVYWLVATFNVSVFMGGIVMLAVVSAIVLIFSCILGWVIAKINSKLKQKSFITVIVSLLFFAMYYFVCFRANALLQSLAANAVTLGGRIKGAAYPLYLFGKMGEGSKAAMLFWFSLSALLLLTEIYILSKTFIKLATATSSSAKSVYKAKRIAKKSPSRALFGKELARFTSSSSYMLNCGIGTIIMPIAAIVLLAKGSTFIPVLEKNFAANQAAIPVLFAAMTIAAASLNDITAPSISLEGRNLWIAQSLPIHPWQALKAKLNLQFAATLLPTAMMSCSAAAIINADAVGKLFTIVFPLLYVFMSACFGLFINLKSPNLTWTNETIPIKQSMSVMAAIFGGWIYTAAFVGLYFFIGYKIGAAAFFIAVSAVTLALAIILYQWLKTKGAMVFAKL